MKRLVYLDYAAATPTLERVWSVMQSVSKDYFANPSSVYATGRSAKKRLEEARAQVAMELGAKSAEIVFCAGATEAINMAILGTVGELGGGVVATPLEHDAVSACLTALRHQGDTVEIVPVGPSGVVDPGQIAAAVTDETVLVCLQYANHELGTIQPLTRMATALQAIRRQRQMAGNRRPLYLLCDASQAAGSLDLHASRLGVDLMIINAAKIYGPKQSAVLYVKAGTHLTPILYGGGQEGGLRSGTESLVGAAGLAEALQLAQAHRHEENQRLSRLSDELWAGLTKHFPAVRLNGEPRRRLPGHFNILLPGADGERLVYQLDEAGFQVATGAACAATKAGPSAVLLAIGLSADEARSSLRITLGRSTTSSDLKAFVSALAAAIKQQAK